MNYRIIDANINRVNEGLRCIEEYTRFVLNNEEITTKLKNIRHEISIYYNKYYENLISARNTTSDVGTNIKNIFACGDCTQKYDIVTREPAYLGLGTIANKEGRVAAINATCSKDFEVFDGILSSVITRFFDYTISKTGLTLQDAFEYSKKVNLEPISATITKKDKASYMPSSNEVTLKIVADKRSGEILGAQSIGCVGNVAQRINTITSALKARLTVDELLHLDLAYAPPYSSSIDPILTAAYKLKEQIKK